MDKIAVREWILIIALLMLIEYLISSNSYTFRDDQTLLNYISFSSTIASILLAVIAIIYGFLQSDSNSKANNKLLDSLDEFKKVHNKILKNSEKSEKQLDRLSSITNILESLNNSMDQSSSKIALMENKIFEMHESSKIVKDEIIKISNIKNNSMTDKEDESSITIARIMLRRSTIYADFIAYALNIVNSKKEIITIAEFGNKYLVPIKNHVTDEDKSIFDDKIVIACVFTILNMLKAAKLISINEEDNHIIISRDLSKELPIFSEEIRKGDIPLVKLVINTIDSL